MIIEYLPLVEIFLFKINMVLFLTPFFFNYIYFIQFLFIYFWLTSRSSRGGLRFGKSWVDGRGAEMCVENFEQGGRRVATYYLFYLLPLYKCGSVGK